MNLRSVALGIGIAITTFLLAGAATIELLGAGEAPAVGIIGVFVGVLSGLLAGAIVSAYADRISGMAATALVAYGTFGIVFVAIAGLSYVNVLDDVFTFPVHLATSVVVALAVALLAGRGSFGDRPVAV